jgi:carboxyl-terminal processing protease
VNLTSSTPLSIMGAMMQSCQAPSRWTRPELNHSERPMTRRAKHVRRLRQLHIALALVIGLGAAAPSGASVFSAPELTCGRSYDLVKSLLKRHISFRELNPELRERAIDSYIERIDPSKTLFLSSEVKALRLGLRGVFFGMQNGECELLEELHLDLVERYARMEKEVREFVSNDEYALDTDVRLILDSDKRGHPPDDEARKRLVERLIHFQMSNYLSGDMELDEAKKKLIHRYELMTKRVRELEARDTYGTFLNAFASALDPHSTYYPPEAVEDFEIQMSLSLDGIGVALSSKDGYSVVERIIPGGATDKAGVLEPSDKIIAVAQEDEQPVDIIDMSLRDVVAIIRGERGTKVKLTILRKGDTTERLEVEIERDKVTIEDAAATLEFREVEIGGVNRKLAILDLPTFYGDSDPSKRQSTRDVRDLLRQVRDAKADGLLLDLSRNGGGKLESSVEIAGLFIRKGGIVAVKNVFSEVQVLEDNDEDIVYDGPLVILTSRLTASASEIVAGAMKDYGRAVIVGDDHTFGKGTVQSFVHQPGRLGAIKVTTALFFRPGGASTQHEGVSADIVLPSIFATDDLGERYTQYSLTSQMIAPFLEKPAPLTSSNQSKQAWPDLSDEVFFELKRRSQSRVDESEEFAEINEQLAKIAAEDDVIHLAELIRERKAAEGEEEGTETPKAEASSEAVPAEETKTEDGAKPEAEPAKGTGEDDETTYNEEEPEPTPQREEAIRILADLVEIQESTDRSWHVPQSASRLEPLSSQP